MASDAEIGDLLLLLECIWYAANNRDFELNSDKDKTILKSENSSLSNLQYLISEMDKQSINRIPTINIDAHIIRLAKFVKKELFPASDSVEDFGKYVTTLNRCWKLFYLGIKQADPISRYIGLIAICRIASTISEDMVAYETGKVSKIFYKRIFYIYFSIFRLETSWRRIDIMQLILLDN